jgi:hypothetical protein
MSWEYQIKMVPSSIELSFKTKSEVRAIQGLEIDI